MRKFLTIMLALSLFACTTAALADGGSADFSWEGTTYHVTYEKSEIVDGKLNVTISGFGQGVPIRNNKIVVIAWIDVITNGKRVEGVNVKLNGDGTYTYIFETDQLPEEVILMASEDLKTDIPMWKTGDPEGAASEEPAEEAAGIPEGLAGEWHGTGTPKNGGPSIDLTVRIEDDGTGDYTFVQAGYTESYPFTIIPGENTFSVQIPEDNYLKISECGGSWAIEDGKLKLDILTKFAGGGSYSYTAECEKAAAEE